MFLDFRKIIKEEKMRGWSLQKTETEYYFSKFDDVLNDDEFRLFIGESDEGIFISRADKIKHSYKTSTPKILSVKMEHTYVKEAKRLCTIYNHSKDLIHI